MSMNLHEKSLELNITHELLNLCDSFHWHIVNIGLWRYWEPDYRHFRNQNQKKSIALGLHSSVEGKEDNTGNAGGGYDVKIKSGRNDSVLFIQYKRGEYLTSEPPINGGNRSIFRGDKVEHYVFKLNSTRTNQHFTLRNLSDNITSQGGNAVVYAFPLIKDMDELEEYAGRIINRTKFISIQDIDNEAILSGNPFIRDTEHKYRICPNDLDRTEINYYYYYYQGKDVSKDIISDFINLNIQKEMNTLSKFLNLNKLALDKEKNRVLSRRINYSLSTYLAFLRNYFELPPLNRKYSDFDNKLTLKRNEEIYEIVNNFIKLIRSWIRNGFEGSMPDYSPKYFTKSDLDIEDKSDKEYLDNLNMFVI